MPRPASASFTFPEGYRIDLTKSGMLVTTTDYHPRPLRVSWKQIRNFAQVVGISLNEGGGRTSKASGEQP